MSKSIPDLITETIRAFDEAGFVLFEQIQQNAIDLEKADSVVLNAERRHKSLRAACFGIDSKYPIEEKISASELFAELNKSISAYNRVVSDWNDRQKTGFLF